MKCCSVSVTQNIWWLMDTYSSRVFFFSNQNCSWLKHDIELGDVFRSYQNKMLIILEIRQKIMVTMRVFQYCPLDIVGDF